MDLSEIKTKMVIGDIGTAGRMLGLSQANAQKALERVGSKHHQAMVDILKQVIRMREIIAQEAREYQNNQKQAI